MKLLTITKLMALFGLIASNSALFSMAPSSGTIEDEKPVIAIHTSSIGPNEDKGKIIAGALSAAPKLLFWHPTILLKVRSIVEQGKKIARTTQGTGNIVHALLEDFNLTDDEEMAILNIAMAPVPNQETQTFIEEAKRRDHKVILITNRDTEDYKIYKRIMEEKGVNLDELFDGVVTIPTTHKLNLGDQSFIVNEDNNNHFIAKEPMPNASFSQAMRALADKFDTMAPIWCIPEPKNAEAHAQAITDESMSIRGFKSLNDLRTELERHVDRSAAESAVGTASNNDADSEDNSWLLD